MNKKPKAPPIRTTRALRTPDEPSLDAIPRWLPALVYALATIVLFREFVFENGRLLGTDTLGAGYFARDFYTNFVHTFKSFPLWNPLQYGGLPFIDGMHGDIFYPPSIAMFFLNAEAMWGWKMMLHVFLAGVFTYLWLRELNVSRGSALLGGLIFMMGADLVSLVFPGGDGKLFVSALAPLAFLLTERAVRLRRVRDYAAFALGIALLVFTSHMQLAYFCIWGVTLYFIFRLVQLKRSGDLVGRTLALNFGAFALAGILGVGAAAIQFFPPLSYLREASQRTSKTLHAEQDVGYEYSTSWSLHPEEVMSLVVPDFVGDNVQTQDDPGTSYWGRNAVKLNSEYAGLVPLLLLPLLFLRRRRGQTIFFALLAVFAITYGLGADTPLFRLYYMIPGVKLFRAPSLIIFLYGLSIATLAALAFDRASELGRGSDRDVSVARRTLWIAVGVVGLLALLAGSGVLTSVWLSMFGAEIPAEKGAALTAQLPAIKKGFAIALFVAIGVTLAWEGFARRMWSARTALVAVAVIAFVELYRVDRSFIEGTVLMNENVDNTTFAPDPSIDYLRQQQAAGHVFRVYDLANMLQVQAAPYPQNAFATHGLEQTAGHHGNEMGRYRELLGSDQPVNAVMKSPQLFDLTNTEYLTSPAPVEIPGYSEVFRGDRTIVYRNANVLPRAYLVGKVEVVPADKAVDHLLTPGFDFRNTALIEEPLASGITIQPNPAGSVQWLERQNTEQRIKVRTDRPALLVVSDNFYHAWKAQVDGRDTPVLRANHAFRAVPVPAGEHDVTFRYDRSYLRGPLYTTVLILLVLTVLAFGPFLRDALRARRVGEAT